MSLDLVNERAGMLARAGSFWYRTVSEEDRAVAYTLSQVGCLSRANRQISNAAKATLSGGHFQDHFLVIRFSDKDIVYFGNDEILQKRYVNVVHDYEALQNVYASLGIEYPYPDGPVQALGRPRDVELSNATFVSDGDDEAVLGDMGVPIVVPSKEEGAYIVMPSDFRPTFGLLVDPDVLVTSIETPDGILYTRGADFDSTYGFIAFRQSPTALFPFMKLMAKSYTRRERNILNYTLQLNDVFGPVDRVVNYYRKSQSIKAYYMAAAQAAGMAVIREDCRIVEKVPFKEGAYYITNMGTRYDAPYPHLHLGIGNYLKEGDVIGHHDLFRILTSDDSLDQVSYVYTGRSTPVQDMKVPNSEQQITKGGFYRPGYATEEYLAYLSAMDGAPVDPEGDVVTGNALEDFLKVRLGGRGIIVRINRQYMPRDMYISLMEFLEREAPLGSVLTYCPITDIIPT